MDDNSQDTETGIWPWTGGTNSMISFVENDTGRAATVYWTDQFGDHRIHFRPGSDAITSGELDRLAEAATALPKPKERKRASRKPSTHTPVEAV